MKKIWIIFLAFLFVYNCALAENQTVFLLQPSDGFQISLTAEKDMQIETTSVEDGFSQSTLSKDGAAEVHIIAAFCEPYAGVSLADFDPEKDADSLQKLANYAIGQEGNTMFEIFSTPAGIPYMVISVAEDGSFNCCMTLYNGYLLLFTQYEEDFSVLSEESGSFLQNVINSVSFSEE